MEHGVKQLGFRGFEIGGSVNGDELANSKFNPVWAKAEELGILLLLHPATFVEGLKRFQGNGFLPNVIGNPLETTVAFTHLIFEGTLDRYPGLKICGSHGGGYLPSYLGRTDHCAEISNRCQPVKKHPSEYFKEQLYCDSIVFTAEGLRHLVAEVGASHILFGTDFPFDVADPFMGDPREADFVLGAAGLSEADRRAILGDTSAKLLGINRTGFSLSGFDFRRLGTPDRLKPVLLGSRNELYSSHVQRSGPRSFSEPAERRHARRGYGHGFRGKSRMRRHP
jgi:aminocarboxymuconate-semialdehyde decarboxylase